MTKIKGGKRKSKIMRNLEEKKKKYFKVQFKLYTRPGRLLKFSIAPSPGPSHIGLEET